MALQYYDGKQGGQAGYYEVSPEGQWTYAGGARPTGWQLAQDMQSVYGVDGLAQLFNNGFFDSDPEYGAGKAGREELGKYIAARQNEQNDGGDFGDIGFKGKLWQNLADPGATLFGGAGKSNSLGMERKGDDTLMDWMGSPITAGTEGQDAAQAAAIAFGLAAAAGAAGAGGAGGSAAAGGSAGGTGTGTSAAIGAGDMFGSGAVYESGVAGLGSGASAGGGVLAGSGDMFGSGSVYEAGAAELGAGGSGAAATVSGGGSGAPAAVSTGMLGSGASSTGLLSNPQLLGAAGGALLGGMGGGGDAKTVQTEEGLPDWLMPYAKPALDQYSTQIQNLNTDPYGIMPSAMKEFKSTIEGQYLDPSTNKYLEDYYKLGAERIKGSLQPSFGHMQAFGAHSGYGEALSRGLGDFATGLYGGNYAKERDRQTSMTASAPQFLAQSSTQQTLPYQQYLQSLSGLGKKKEDPFFTNPMGGILGGAMMGSQLGSLWK